MTQAILFWCYRDPELCLQRLTLLRVHNPQAPVYVLFGGEIAAAPAMATALSGLINDFWVFDDPLRDSHWKWRHGDLMIAEWYRQRGQRLAWDCLMIVQWDMLVAAPLHVLLAGIGPKQLLLSGLRPVAEVARWWGWIHGTQPEQGPEYRAFERWLRHRTGYRGELLCCLFIVVCLPRDFLHRYAGPLVSELGFLEYKIPSLAAAWGFDFWRDHPFAPWWASDPATRNAPPKAKLLNAVGEELSQDAIYRELQTKGGLRLFHPVRKIDFSKNFYDILVSPAERQPQDNASKRTPTKMNLPVRKPSLFLCRICGAASGHRRHTAREMMFGTRESFAYIECGRCHCIQIETIPENMARFYPEEYYAHAGNLDEEFSALAKRRRAGKRIRWLLHAPEALAALAPWNDMRRPLWSMRHLKFSRQDSILDIGCGNGRLLYLLSLAGFSKLAGCDPALKNGLSWGNGLQIHAKPLKDIDGVWPVIMMHHALEHIPDQIATLRHIRRLLAPRGYCLIRLPVAQSQAWRRYGTHWVQFDAPRHLYLHTWESLERAAEAAGLVVERVTCDSYSLQFWGSEQYRDDIPLYDPRSYRWGQGAPRFSAAQIAAWEHESRKLNAAGQGDQAAFILRPASDMV